MSTFELLKIAIAQGNRDGSRFWLDLDTPTNIAPDDTDADGESFVLTFGKFDFESDSLKDQIREVYLASFWQAVEEHQGQDHTL